MFEGAAILARLRERPTDEVRAIYERLDALEARVHAMRLLALAVLDEREAHRNSGAADTEGWVASESKVSRSTAIVEVRTARRLADLPHVADAATEGRLSPEQLESVVQLANEGSDERWAAEAPAWSPSALQRAVRNRKVVEREEANRRHRERALRAWSDPAAGMLRFSGALPDAEGAVFWKAIEREAERIGRNPDGTWDAHEARCADALVTMASATLADDGDPDRAQVVVHAPAAALVDSSTTPGSEIPDLGLSLAIDTVRRLACDATTQALFESADGSPIGLGRRARTVPRWMYRLLRKRDQHCRFPGCDRTRALHAHHIVHWADGGPTDLANLVLLCPFHHRFLHEQRWTIAGDPNDPAGLDFRSPTGRPPQRDRRAARPGGPRAAAHVARRSHRSHGSTLDYLPAP